MCKKIDFANISLYIFLNVAQTVMVTRVKFGQFSTLYFKRLIIVIVCIIYFSYILLCML